MGTVMTLGMWAVPYSKGHQLKPSPVGLDRTETVNNISLEDEDFFCGLLLQMDAKMCALVIGDEFSQNPQALSG